MRSLLLFLFTTAALCMHANADDGASPDTFQSSLAAYQNKNYQEARDGFQKLLSSGETSANLLHNLALTEYQLDQKAMALALWRKALYLEPKFAAARAGRDLLESQGTMRPYETDSVSLWRSRWLQNFSIFEILWLTAVLLAVAGALWIRYLARRRIALEDEKPFPAFPASAVAATAVFAAVIVIAAFKALDLSVKKATVTAVKVNIKSLPAETGVAVGDVAPGSEVKVTGRQPGWLQVQNYDGLSGWVRDSEVLITTER